MEAIMKWPVPTNVIEVRIFVGEAQYLQNFIASCSEVATPLHIVKGVVRISNGGGINKRISMS
jgi:hypothetical protein